MQVGAVDVKPCLGAFHIGTYAGEQAPEPPLVVHFQEVGDLMGREIIEHVAWRQHQSPRERQRAGGGARAPSARLVADGNPPHRDTETVRVMRDSGFKIAFGFALEMVGYTPRNMFGMTGDTQQPPTVAVDFRPHGATCAAPMRDCVDDTA